MLTEVEPVDMSTVLPYTAYHYWAPSYDVYNENKIVEHYYYDSISKKYEKGDESNFTIDNGKILIDFNKYSHTWNYLGNNITTYDNEKESFQIVKKLGRYDVLLDERVWSSYYIDPNLKDKTWQDIVGADIVIDGWAILEENGSVSYYSYTDQNNTIVKSADSYDNLTYTINGEDLIITHHYYNDEYNETFTLDSSSGRVSKSDKCSCFDITSSLPIVKEEIVNSSFRPLAKTTNKTPYQNSLEKKYLSWRK
jgi:hypothetical protein